MEEQSENKFALAIQARLTETLIQKAASLPKNFNQTKFIQNCITALDSIKDIEKCEPMSVVKVLMKGAVLGLDFLNKECYAICYKNKDTGKVDVNFQTDYKGDRKLAKIYSVEPIETIQAELVRAGDEFGISYIDNKKMIEFRPVVFSNNKIIGAFCVVNYKDGSSISEVMSVAEMDQVRKDYSKAKNSPSWDKSPGEMYKKTVQKRVLKLVEKSFESPEQLRAYEESSDFEFNKPEALKPVVVSNVFAKPAAPQIETKPENDTIIEAETTTPSEPNGEFMCSCCGVGINEAENGYSKKKFNKALCRACQDLAKKGEI